MSEGKAVPKLFNTVKDAANAAGILLNSIRFAEVVFNTVIEYEFVPSDMMTVEGKLVGVIVSKNIDIFTGPVTEVVIVEDSAPIPKPFIMLAEIDFILVAGTTSVDDDPAGISIGMRVSPNVGI